ncbi:hypothetical protein [Mesorhizobium sp. URHB0026]
MFIDANTTRTELEDAICCTNGLYEQFDEQKFLGGGYTTDELRDMICDWISAGDECKAA